MEKKEKTKDVYFDTSIDNVCRQLKNRSNIQICGGCTFLKTLPQVSLITRNIATLKQIDKRERYMEIGAGVTLSEIIALGEKNVPSILFQAINSVATPPIRNMATLGGNLCLKPMRGTLFASLLAIDSSLEFTTLSDTKTSSESIIIPISQFREVPPFSILTKVKIPLDDWDLSIFKRVGSSWQLDKNCASYAFLASIQKETLVNLRIAFCGIIQIRSRELENKLIGTKLPLSLREIADVLEAAGEYFDQQEALFYSENKRKEDTERKDSQRARACSSLGHHMASCKPSTPDFPLLKARFLGLLQSSLNQLI